MDKIVSVVFAIGLLTFVVLMPMWVALAVRLVFRRTTKRRILAILTALPFALWLIIKSLDRGRFLPTLEARETYGIIFTIITTAVLLSANLLVNFGIPYLLTKAGIAIGDKIMKKRQNRVDEKSDIAPDH